MSRCIFILLFLISAKCVEDEDSRPLPKACIDAKCVFDNEWINIEDKYTPDRLNDSGKCFHEGIESGFDDGWTTMLAGLEEINAPKRLALRHIENEYLWMCGPDAYEGCSFSRRLKAASAAMLYWHQWGDVWIPWMTEQGKVMEAWWMISSNYFPTVVAPGFFLCHSVNILVLKKMLIDDKTAIVFHLAEVITDMASCFFSVLFPTCLHVFAGVCMKVSDHRALYQEKQRIFTENGFGDMYYLDRMPTWEKMMNAVCGFIAANQLFNLCLVISRWYCLAHTASYIQMNDSSKVSVAISGAMASFCILLAMWPGKPIASDLLTVDLEEAEKGENWQYAWYVYPFFKDSEFGKFLIKSKPSVIVVLYTSIYVAQIMFSCLVLRRFWAYSRNELRLQNETEEGAKKRKASEKQKVSLMIGTVAVNLVCMFPTLVLTLCNSFGLRGPLLSGFAAMQLFATGLNSIGGFFTHLIFTNSYRQAFKKAILPCMKDTNKTSTSNTNKADPSKTNGALNGTTAAANDAVPEVG